jgi:hypothetical protein
MVLEHGALAVTADGMMAARLVGGLVFLLHEAAFGLSLESKAMTSLNVTPGPPDSVDGNRGGHGRQWRRLAGFLFPA